MKLCACCSAVKHRPCFYMGTCFTAWMFTGTVTLVGFPLLLQLCPDQMSFRLGWRQYSTRGHFGSASLKPGDISMMHWWSRKMSVRWWRSGWKVTTSGVTCSFSLCTHDINNSSCGNLVALSIPCFTFSPS